MPSWLRSVIYGVPPIVLLIAGIFVLMPFCATCGGHDEAVTEVLLKCPRAKELLGDDAHPARFGVACGSTETQGDFGKASWTVPYTGSRDRGTVQFSASKDGEWRVHRAVLEVGDETIDLVACAGMKAPRGDPRGTLAQTNADAAKAEFSGKVIRSSNATVAVGHECTGTLARERGSATAAVKVTCRSDGSQAEGTPLYDGRGAFTLDVRDASKQNDDRIEFDSKSTPSCRLSAADGKGTLTVWQADWEVVIEL